MSSGCFFRRNLLPQGKGKIFYVSMMGTEVSLSAKENIRIMHFLEEENLRLAKERDFKGILTINTSPLTQVIRCFVFILTRNASVFGFGFFFLRRLNFLKTF